MPSWINCNQAFKDSEKAGAASMRRALLKGGGTMRVGGQTAHPVGAKLAISNLPQANRKTIGKG